VPRKDAPDAWLLSFAAAGNEGSEPALVESATRLGGLRGAFTWRTARLAEIDALRSDPTLLALCRRLELGLWKPAVIAEFRVATSLFITMPARGSGGISLFDRASSH